MSQLRFTAMAATANVTSHMSTVLASNISVSQLEKRHGMITLPYDMTFNDESIVAIASYSVMFVISATGNLAVLIALCSAGDDKQGNSGEARSRVKKRVVQRRGFSLLIMHLCVADLVVTFVFIPLEVGWHATVAWTAGDTACRALMFARAFGFYLSSFVLVAIAIDRYLCLDPLHNRKSERRVYAMLAATWIASFVASVPQVRLSCAIGFIIGWTC